MAAMHQSHRRSHPGIMLHEAWHRLKKLLDFAAIARQKS